MKKPLLRRVLFPLVLVLLALLLLLPGSVLAVQSPAYHLDWFTPLTGSGGPSGSTGYLINLTVGQTVNGPVSSANFKMNLGYWQNHVLRAYLPAVVKP